MAETKASPFTNKKPVSKNIDILLGNAKPKTLVDGTAITDETSTDDILAARLYAGQRLRATAATPKGKELFTQEDIGKLVTFNRTADRKKQSIHHHVVAILNEISEEKYTVPSMVVSRAGGRS